jgi:hypothetical protein
MENGTVVLLLFIGLFILSVGIFYPKWNSNRNWYLWGIFGMGTIAIAFLGWLAQK